MCVRFAGPPLRGAPPEVHDKAPDRGHARLRSLLQAMHVAYPDERFASTFGELLAKPRRSGTAAAADCAALVTRNRNHFDRIPWLQVLGY